MTDAPWNLQPPRPGHLPPPPQYPSLGPPVPPPGNAGLGAALLVALVSSAAALVMWFLSKDTLAQRGLDGRHFLVQLTLFTVAGAGWALAQPGERRLLRAGLGLIAGVAVGVGGTFVLGTTEQHQEAAADAVLAGDSLGRAVLWAAVGAAAWAIIVAAGTRRDRIAHAATGAALGGAATGAAMGLLAGTNVFGANVFATDIWWSFPFDGSDDGARAVPLLVTATVVPLVLAASAARAPRLQKIVAAGAVGCLLLPALGGLAGYSTDIDEARRNGVDLDVSSPGDLDVDGGGSSADVDVDVDETAASDGSDAEESSGSTEIEAQPANTTPPFTLPAAPATSSTNQTSSPPATPLPAPPPTRPPATPPATVPSKVDPGYPVFVTSEILASNERRQTATTHLLVGRPYRVRNAPAQVDGGITCAAGPNDAVIPFYLSATPTSGGSATTVTLQFSQTLGAIGDPGAHPITIEFHDAGNGRRCVSAASSDLTTTEAVYEWRNLAGGEEQSGNGYFIVADYFDADGKAPGRRSAVMSVIPTVNDLLTTNTFTLLGADLVRYRDPSTGKRYAAMRLVR